MHVAEGKAKAGDLGAILTCVRDYIGLAVIEILHFRQGGSKMNLAVVDIHSLDEEGPKATMVALQILELVSTEPQTKSDELTWWWLQRYIQLINNEGGPLLQQDLVDWIPGKLFHPITLQIIYNTTNHPIWLLNHSNLECTLAHA